MGMWLWAWCHCESAGQLDATEKERGPTAAVRAKLEPQGPAGAHQDRPRALRTVPKPCLSVAPSRLSVAAGPLLKNPVASPGTWRCPSHRTPRSGRMQGRVTLDELPIWPPFCAHNEPSDQPPSEWNAVTPRTLSRPPENKEWCFFPLPHIMCVPVLPT